FVESQYADTVMSELADAWLVTVRHAEKSISPRGPVTELAGPFDPVGPVAPIGPVGPMAPCLAVIDAAPMAARALNEMVFSPERHLLRTTSAPALVAQTFGVEAKAVAVERMLMKPARAKVPNRVRMTSTMTADNRLNNRMALLEGIHGLSGSIY